jgi:hypothetical protein
MAPPTPICLDSQLGSPCSGIILVPRSSASSVIDQISTQSSTSGATAATSLASSPIILAFFGACLTAIVILSLYLNSHRVHSGMHLLFSSLLERSMMRGEAHEFTGKKTQLAVIWLIRGRTNTAIRNGNFGPSPKSPSSERHCPKNRANY